jgi:pilus assembly protein FimV
VEALDFHLPEVPVTAEPAPAADENIIDFDLDLGASEPVALDEEAAPSLEGLDVQLEEAPLELPASPSFDMSGISLDLAPESGAKAESPEDTVVLADLPMDDGLTMTDMASAETTVLPDLNAEETLVLPDLAMAAEPAAEPAFNAAETVVNPELGAQLAAELEAEAGGDDARYQEVATKLDLAKAYEEMGDLEGARELLQEVLSEGNAEQQDKAKAILEKVAG